MFPDSTETGAHLGPVITHAWKIGGQLNLGPYGFAHGAHSLPMKRGPD